jgi:hypothetical protein
MSAELSSHVAGVLEDDEVTLPQGKHVPRPGTVRTTLLPVHLLVEIFD